jgi:hypothetical protein
MDSVSQVSTFWTRYWHFPYPIPAVVLETAANVVVLASAPSKLTLGD